MSEVNIFAIIYAKPDTIDRVRLPHHHLQLLAQFHTNDRHYGSQVKELMEDLASSVHSKEDYTLRYLVTERVDGGGSDLCIFET